MTTAPTATTFFIEAAGKPTSNVAPKKGGHFWTPIRGQYSKPVDTISVTRELAIRPASKRQ
jgi:hypothetical protein